MKHLILYFSGTGNTWFIAKQAAENLNNSACYSIENDYFQKHMYDLLEEAEHLIIGYPIYGSEAPKPMSDFIEKMPVSKTEKSLSIFCTQAFGSGDGANYLIPIFKEKNYRVLQTKEFKMSNNLYVPIFIRAFPVGDRSKIDKRHGKALKLLKKFTDHIQEEVVSIKKVGSINKALGDGQRKHVGKYIKKLNEAYYADETCIKCGLCVELCPVNNIELRDSIHYLDGCIACMRCYQSCPVSAIQITEKSKNLKKYPRYKGPSENFDFRTLKI